MEARASSPVLSRPSFLSPHSRRDLTTLRSVPAGVSGFRQSAGGDRKARVARLLVWRGHSCPRARNQALGIKSVPPVQCFPAVFADARNPIDSTRSCSDQAWLLVESPVLDSYVSFRISGRRHWRVPFSHCRPDLLVLGW